MRILVRVLPFLLFAFLLVPAAGAATDAATCLSCHESMEGSVKVEKEKYSKSVHGSFDCVMCHMTPKGDQHQGLVGSTPDKAVKDLAQEISPKGLKDPIAQAACVTCHPDQYAAYTKSIHGQNIITKKSSDGPVCTSCHGSPHYIEARPSAASKVYLYNIVISCGSCHEEKHLIEKYHFSPLVMERYQESFHGRKLLLGHTGAPSCASCHGAHDIVSVKDPASPVGSVEAKKKTCGKCHPGATDKFVAAITHQPLHPIAHWTEIGLIILTVSVFVFIIVHVLLDIFADIRDRLFRKGGGH
ncbi:MAG: hypothetical protein M0042_00615 [Nitrospiraceae bacterium]|nr:hypothetical protein [Nitrospiraceae bacterium]